MSRVQILGLGTQLSGQYETIKLATIMNSLAVFIIRHCKFKCVCVCVFGGGGGGGAAIQGQLELVFKGTWYLIEGIWICI